MHDWWQAAERIGYVSQDEPFVVKFGPTEAGWIDINVLPLTNGWPVSATHLDDPFPHLMPWLNDIAAGAACACWSISHEGRGTTRFIYAHHEVGLSPDFSPALLAIHTYFGHVHVRMYHVDAKQLVGAFYREFRRFVESEDYKPDEWEDEFDFAVNRVGARLKTIGSRAIEEYLAEIPEEQLCLDLRHSYPESADPDADSEYP